MQSQCGDSCTVCGHLVDSAASGYLLMAPIAAHRITILHWTPTLAVREEARAACSPEHALEIVAHWMVSGRLDLAFTQPRTAAPVRPPRRASAPIAETALSHKPIGELVINRESVRKLVANDPEALASVLDSLLEALLRVKNHPAKKPPVRATAIRHTEIA